MSSNKKSEKLDRVVSEARLAREARERGYRARALKMYPWICGRCSREFDGKNLRELTVHHRDHDHDNNPADGSNWELLCVYCHDNEHARGIDSVYGDLDNGAENRQATHSPFAQLAAMLEKSK